MPSRNVLENLKEAVPDAVLFTSIPKLDPEETDTASETEDGSDIPAPLTSLYSEEFASLDDLALYQKGKEVWLKVTNSLSKDQIKKLEEKSRNQTVCKLWFEDRKGRITASKGHEVHKHKLENDSKSLSSRIMGYASYDISKHKAMQ